MVLNAYLIGQLVIADIILVLISNTIFGEEHKGIVKIIEFFIKYPYWFLMYWQFFKPSKWYWGILQFILFQILAGIALFLFMLIAAYILIAVKGSH